VAQAALVAAWVVVETLVPAVAAAWADQAAVAWAAAVVADPVVVVEVAGAVARAVAVAATAMTLLLPSSVTVLVA
jgi:hypothetical protein